MKTSVEALSKWYLRHARKLPWRESHDPYRIWISEVMLQQTQVATVIPYYVRFLKRFPTVSALAEAPVEDVLAHWSGLGYYSRARNLKKGAEYLQAYHGGKFPKSHDEILEVPGVGPYTAGAILSIAFDLPEPIVDGNVQRVFARYFGIRTPIQAKETQKRFWQEAAAWVKDAKSPRVLNQALMELGAMVCTKGNPACERCPLVTTCVAEKETLQKILPMKKPRKETVDLWWMGIVLESGGKLFLKKNKHGEWWSDLWDFPKVEMASRKTFSDDSQRFLKKLTRKKRWQELDHQKHTVTHHRIHVAPLHVELTKPETANLDGSWFPIEEVESLPLSSLARKLLRARTSTQVPLMLE